MKEVVEEGRAELVGLLREYEVVSNRFAEELSPDDMEKLIEKQGKLQEAIRGCQWMGA